MKKLFIITFVIVMGLASVSNVFAADKSECVYKSRIDQMINFYQARLYLIDSEYKILSDIGKEAETMVNYLNQTKEQLVQEMKAGKIEFNSAGIKKYISRKANAKNIN